MNPVYYVYALIDPRTDIPFYIGKGKNNRMQMHLKPGTKHGVKKKHRVDEIRAAGFEPYGIKIVENLSESDAYLIEETLIEMLGREDIETNGILTNNRLKAWPPIMTSEVRSAISSWRKGIIFNESHRANLSKVRAGKTYEEIYGVEGAKKKREQLSKKRGPCTEETKRKISETKKGMSAPHSWSQESRKKVSASLSGVSKNLSDEEQARRQELNNTITTCPHCGCQGKGLSMKRWHFKHCKENPN